MSRRRTRCSASWPTARNLDRDNDDVVVKDALWLSGHRRSRSRRNRRCRNCSTNRPASTAPSIRCARSPIAFRVSPAFPRRLRRAPKRRPRTPRRRRPSRRPVRSRPIPACPPCRRCLRGSRRSLDATGGRGSGRRLRAAAADTGSHRLSERHAARAARHGSRAIRCLLEYEDGADRLLLYDHARVPGHCDSRRLEARHERRERRQQHGRHVERQRRRGGRRRRRGWGRAAAARVRARADRRRCRRTTRRTSR